MKYSKFNHIINLNDKRLLYNSNSNALFEVDTDFMKRIKERNLSSEEEKLLIQKKVFVKNDDFELNRMKFETHAARSNKDLLSITIIPTYACNFNCVYCYEEDRPNINWSKDLQDSLFEYIKKQNCSKNQIAWYGGEPLLQIESIAEFSKRLIKANIDYTANMVTNGYLLDLKSIELLKNSKVDDLQITIDGNENTHNKKRPLMNGKATYSKIIQNIKLLEKHHPSVVLNIRVNVDKNNYEEFPIIYSKLRKELNLEKMFIYPGIIEDHNSSFKNHDCLMDRHDVVKLRKWLLQEHGINLGVYPEPNRHECMARMHNTFVFGADGEIYKCWLDINKKEKSIGNIIENKIDNLELFYNYVEGANQFEDKLCMECSLIPICAGGCTYTRLKNSYEKSNIDGCHLAKDYIEDLIKLHYYEKNK